MKGLKIQLINFLKIFKIHFIWPYQMVKIKIKRYIPAPAVFELIVGLAA